MAEADTTATDTGPFVRPDVRGFLDFLNAVEGPTMSQVGPALAREAYLAMGASGEAEPRELAIIKDLTFPGPAGDVRLRFYDSRETREAGPAVVFFHGGGFVIGDLDTHHSLCTEVAAELDLPVIAVDYRLAPEHTFPAAPLDCIAAARWVATSPAELGRTITGLIPMGDSAGGNLTIVVTQALMDEPAAVPVVVQVPIYPLSDDRADHASFQSFADGFLLTAETMQWFAEAYAAVPGDRLAYPIYNDHAATPPTVLVTASLDPIRDSGRVYGEALIRAGAELVFLERKGTIHGFTQLRKALPSANEDMKAIFAAVKLLLERTR